MKGLLYGIAMAFAVPVWCQTLDPTLMKGSPPSSNGWSWLNQQEDVSAWSVELVLGLNTPDYFAYDDHTDVIRQAMKQCYPEISGNALSEAVNNMSQYFGNSDNRMDGNQTALVHLRLGATPFQNKGISIYLGAGKDYAAYYSKAEQGENSIALNNHEDMVRAFVDDYFILQDLFGYWLPDDPHLPDPWKPFFLELGGGYQPHPQMSIFALWRLIPRSSMQAENWHDQINQRLQNISVEALSDVKTSSQLTLGFHVHLGVVRLGLESHRNFFLGDVKRFWDQGSLTLPNTSYAALSIGVHF